MDAPAKGWMIKIADEVATRFSHPEGVDSEWIRDEIDLYTSGELDTTQMDIMEDMVRRRLYQRHQPTN